MSPHAIDTHGLTKRYRDDLALDGLDLSVPKGDVYGFLGPNGAGKTTTIRILLGLLEPTDGTATVAGHPVTDRDALQRAVGYMPDSPSLYSELSASEQLAHFARLRDVSDPDQRVAALLDRFGLAKDAHRPVCDYSKGMQRKVGLIGALVHDPDVLFLDEPVSGLDPRAARTVRETIADLAGGDVTVFLSTHVLPVVDELADTVGVLAGGSIVAEDGPDALKRRVGGSDGTLEDAFVGVTEDLEAV